MAAQRLDKIIASTGRWSRREVKELVRQGRVTVNGAATRSAEEKTDPETAEITVNGEALPWRQYTWVMLNKPAGYLSATEDGRGATVLDLLPQELQRQHLFPVGRLDKDTEGLLLLTNQGDLVNEILRSSRNHEKEYVVTVNKQITDDFLKKMQNGVELPELSAVTKPCVCTRSGNREFHIVLKQGLNRQIRRMCEALGYHVESLKRIRIMNIRLGNLPKGNFRNIADDEFLEMLRLFDKETEK